MLKMSGAKRRWRGEEHDPAGRERVDCPLVGVEPDERAVVGHVHAVLELLVQRSLHRRDPLGEDVGHRRELHAAAAGVEGIDDGAAAPAATADECRVDLIAAGDVHPAGGNRGRCFRRGPLPLVGGCNRRGGDRCAGRSEKTPATGGGASGVGVRHESNSGFGASEKASGERKLAKGFQVSRRRQRRCA